MLSGLDGLARKNRWSCFDPDPDPDPDPDFDFDDSEIGFRCASSIEGVCRPFLIDR